MRTIPFLLSSALIWSLSWAQQPSQSAPAPAPAEKKIATTAGPSTSGLSVTEASIALGLEEYEPVNPGEKFPADVGRLYCYSRIKGATDSMEIQHRWYWNDDLITTIPLKVKSNNWRTYSIKTIIPGMTGEWMVAIVNAQKEEEVLQTLKFTIQ
jgi:hypothetical protein